MLLKLYDLNKKKIAGLKNAKGIQVESVLSTGDKTLSFVWHKRNLQAIPMEYYIRTDTDEYVVKENSSGSNGYRNIVAKLNLEELEGKSWKNFVSENATAKQAADFALAGTGWTCISTVPATKLRNISLTKVTSYKIFEKILLVYACEVIWDTLNKVVHLQEKVGSDKGAYFIKGLNLKDLSDDGDTYDYITRIIPIGSDELDITSVNNGVEYLDNHQYSDKIKTLIWEDSNYTDAQALKDDAIYKLNELSKPKVTYSVKVFDLARMKPGYSILSYGIGDTIALKDPENEIDEKQRITRTVEYLNNPEKNTCEISNTKLSFADMQKQLFAAAEAVANITTDNGTVKGSSVDAIDVSQIIGLSEYVQNIDTLTVDHLYVTTSIGAPVGIIGDLTSTGIESTTINVSKRLDAVLGYITALHTTNAYLDYANIGTIESDQLSAIDASIQNLKTNYADIKILMFGSATGTSITTEFANSVVSVVGAGQISDAQIDSLSVSKVLAGDISTTKFRIISDSGKMLLADNTMQISDANRVRVQIGKDASDDYNMYVWDASGNLMFDATGLKASGIKSAIIRDNMVAEDAAISGSKINITSLVTAINGGTSTIKSSKIYVDADSQTMDVLFQSMKTTVTGQGNQITAQGTALSTIQGQITSKIWQTDINESTGTIQTQLTQVQQTAEKISWIVSSGTSQADMTLTADMYRLVAENIDLTGKVTFNSLDSSTQTKINTAESNASSALGKLSDWSYAATTEINGAKIRTGTVTADKISVASLEAIVAKIGGFTVGSTAIYNGTYSATSTTAGIYLGTDAIRAYSSTSQYFHVENGKMTCYGADIKGNIYADTNLYMKNSVTGAYASVLQTLTNGAGSYTALQFGAGLNSLYIPCATQIASLLTASNATITSLNNNSGTISSVGSIAFTNGAYINATAFLFTGGTVNGALSVTGTLSATGRSYLNGGFNTTGDAYWNDVWVIGQGTGEGNQYFNFYSRSVGYAVLKVIQSGGIYINGDLQSTGVYNSTTTSAGNVNSTPAYYLKRSTSSSLRYKTDIVDLPLEDVEELYNVPVRRFKYKESYLSSDDERYGIDMPGFIVEELEKYVPEMNDHLADGSPEMWNIKMMFPASIKLIQDLNDRLKYIESTVKTGGESYITTMLSDLVMRVALLESKLSA